MNQLLDGLAEKGFVTRYVADGVPYVAILTFQQHQRPKHDEAVSLIPAPLLGNPRGKETAPRPYKGQRDLGSGILTEGSGADGAPLAADGAAIRETADGADHRRLADDFAELWNALTHSPIPRCRDLSSKRRRHIRARLSERPLSEWQAVFERIQASTFCRGETHNGGWVASFDWVIGSPDVALKVLEGKYDDRGRGAKVAERDYIWPCPHGGQCGSQTNCRNKQILERARVARGHAP